MAAGIVVLLSVTLTLLVHPYWVFLAGFAGLNLLQSAFSDWCPMVNILERLGCRRCVPVASAQE